MKVKGTGSRMASNPEQEPNFYHMAFMPAADAEYENSNDNSNSSYPATATSQDYTNTNTNTTTEALPSSAAFASSSPDYQQSSHKVVVPEVAQSTAQTDDNNLAANVAVKCEEADEDMNDLNFVFDNMPFHELTGSGTSRRHSLMDSQRVRRLSAQFRRNSSHRSSLRNSLLLLDSEGRRSSVMTLAMLDDEFEKEMESICQIGENVLSDQEMSELLDKIIDKRII